MNDAFHAVCRDHAFDEVLIRGLAEEQRNTLGKVRGKAGRQVVDYENGFASLHQRMSHVTSDIAGAAGDKHTHEFTHLRLFRRCYPGRGEEWVSAQANWPLCLMLRIGNARNGARTLRRQNISADGLQLIVPNLHRRYSGVTATNRMVAPKLAKMFRAAWLGPDVPEGIGRIGLADLAKLWRRRAPLIWHARRNNEMIVGVLLRSLGWPLKLVFTSAAQRHHTWITRWLIDRMDAIMATNEIAAAFLKRQATVIPAGVDTDRYAPPADRMAAFAQTGLPGRYAIGCFGRVRAQKGTDVFVEAMCRLLPRHPDFVAVLVGAITPEQMVFANDLRKRIEAAGLKSRIVITGELDRKSVV